MRDKPPTCAPCPLYKRGYGFALDCGDPARAKYALLLEAPGRDEIAYRLLDPVYNDPGRDRYNRDEYERRRKAYPALPEIFIRRGMSLVGKSWGIMAMWCFRKLGIKREDLFIGNVLRCLPPKSGKTGDAYPTGEDRKQAELCCRQYDTQLRRFNPSVVIVTIHPAALTRSITPLPLLIRSCEKLRDCGARSIRAALLCGGKSVKLWLGYYDSVTRFQGHYAWFAPCWYNKTMTRLQDAAKAKVAKRTAGADRAVDDTGERRARGRRVKAAGGITNLMGE